MMAGAGACKGGQEHEKGVREGVFVQGNAKRWKRWAQKGKGM